MEWGGKSAVCPQGDPAAGSRVARVASQLPRALDVGVMRAPPRHRLAPGGHPSRTSPAGFLGDGERGAGGGKWEVGENPRSHAVTFGSRLRGGSAKGERSPSPGRRGARDARSLERAGGGAARGARPPLPAAAPVRCRPADLGSLPPPAPRSSRSRCPRPRPSRPHPDPYGILPRPPPAYEAAGRAVRL